MSSIQKITNLKGISYRVFIRRKGIKTITKTFPSKELAILINTNLKRTYIFGANFESSNLKKSNFNETKTSTGDELETPPGAWFAFTDLSEVDFTAAILTDSNFMDANLYKANFTGADLEGTSFSGANLKDANLTDANLKNSEMSGAILCNTKTPWGIDNSGCKKK